MGMKIKMRQRKKTNDLKKYITGMVIEITIGNWAYELASVKIIDYIGAKYDQQHKDT